MKKTFHKTPTVVIEQTSRGIMQVIRKDLGVKLIIKSSGGSTTFPAYEKTRQNTVDKLVLNWYNNIHNDT